MCPKYCMGHAYTKNCLCSYPNFKFNCALCCCFLPSLTTLGANQEEKSQKIRENGIQGMSGEAMFG